MAVRAPSRHKPEAVIRERAHIVGDSGRVYMQLAEDGDEIVQLIPVRGPFRPKRERGQQKAATGAELLAMGKDPNDPEVQRQIASGAIKYDTPVATVNAPRPQAASSVSATNPTPSVTGFGAAGVAQHQAQQAVYGAQQADIDASGRVVSASQRLLDANRNVLNSARSTTQANQQALAAEQAQIDLQERLTGEARAAEEGIQAAAGNVVDKVNVARARQARADTDYVYGLGGISAPQEVVVAEGTNLPAGVRPLLETQEDLKRRTEQNSAAMRAFELEGGRLNVARSRAQVEAAQVESDVAQRLAQAAGLEVDAARLATDLSGLGVRQAQLNVARSTQPPTPGQVYDEDTGTFAGSASELRTQQDSRTIVTDPTTGQRVTRGDLLARTSLPDAEGNVNVQRPDGVLVTVEGPGRGNQFREGWAGLTWYGPEGDTALGADGIWRNQAGMEHRDGVWWVPGLGAYARPDGSLVNPQTGQVWYQGQQFQTGGGLGGQALDYENSYEGIAQAMFRTSYPYLSPEQKTTVDTEYYRRRPENPESSGAGTITIDPATGQWVVR